MFNNYELIAKANKTKQ